MVENEDFSEMALIRIADKSSSGLRSYPKKKLDWRDQSQVWLGALVHGSSTLGRMYSVGDGEVQALLELELSLISLNLHANTLKL